MQTPASTGRPPAEAVIDDDLIRRLLAAQFPQWADLPVRAVPSAGWDNVIYRLGTNLAVRLPRRRIGAQQVSKEHRWLPELAGRLPLAVPVVVGRGMPGAGYPWRWSVVRWLPGDIAAVSRDLDLAAAALKLAAFIAALRVADPAGGPVSQFRRELADGDRQVTDAIDALGDPPYREAAIRAWRRARLGAAPRAALRRLLGRHSAARRDRSVHSQPGPHRLVSRSRILWSPHEVFYVTSSSSGYSA